MEIKKILVPTDFSHTAYNALLYAIEIAAEYGSQVDIVHAFTIPVVTARGKPVLPDQHIVDTNEQIALEKLEELKKTIPAKESVKISSKALPIYWQLDFPEVIHQQHTDLVVMGTTGASGWKKTLLGSSATSVIEQARVPVLAIPQQARFAQPIKIGIAYENIQPEEIEKLAIVNSFAKKMDANIHVFTISNVEGAPPPYPDELTRFLPAAEFNHSNVVADSSILQYIQANHLDMLVMISRQQGFFHNLINGSLANRVAYDIPIPLLTIPA